jgi:hypothetical protein
MRITFTPTQKDFMDAQRTHAWRRYNPAMARLQRALEPFVGVFLILFSVHLARTNANRGIVLLEFVLGLYVLLASRVLGPFLYRRAYRQRDSTGPDVTALDFEHDAIYMDSPGHSSGKLEWPAILGTIESETTLLLYLAPARFLIIPKRFLEGSQLKDLSHLLREKNVPTSYPKS